MKRELKRDDSDPRTELDSFIAEPIPMKRELKLFGRLVILLSHFIHCRAYPDEKGIETMFSEMFRGMSSKIAEPIPMKRELKPS